MILKANIANAHGLILCMGILLYHISNGQNLVPNPNFDLYSLCPVSAPAGPGPLNCEPWQGVYSSADYFNACNTGVVVSVPINFIGIQPAKSGAGYCGGYFHFTQVGALREFIQAQLMQPLEADSCYLVGCSLNRADETCGTDCAGILLTNTAIAFPIGMSPQVEWGGSYLSDSLGWQDLLGYIVADGTEQYITIGNFAPHAECSIDPDCHHAPWAYYYIEDVYVVKVPPGNASVSLGPDITACDFAVLDPGLSIPASYHWSTGEQTPTITVYTSGTYSLTINYACSEAEAEIDVVIFNPDPVEIGPPSLSLCAGESFDISLDPDLGTYIWSDGSTSPEYSITATGLYSVTMDDGCELSTDVIEVEIIDPPVPFTLGNDTIICEGEELDIQLDPGLGDFTWQDGSNSSGFTITTPGMYSLSISNPCGQESDDILVEFLDIPFVSLGPDTLSLCDNETYLIEFDPDLGTFTWQDGSQEWYYDILTEGEYSVTVSNMCGSDQATIYAQYSETPFVMLGPAQSICEGDTLVLNPGPVAGDFLWQDGSMLPNYSVTSTGSYSVTVTNDCGTSAGTIDISLIPLPQAPDLGPDVNLCPGESLILNVNSPGSFYAWSDGTTADSLLITTAGTYFVDVFSVCGSFSDTILVTASTDPPALSLPDDFALCSGQSYTLSSGVTGVIYAWSDGSSGPDLLITTPGEYALTISNSCGSAMDTVFVSDGGVAPGVSLGPDTAICSGTSIVITPIFTNVDTWTWSDGSSLPTFVASSSGIVFIDAVNGCGIVSDTLVIGALPDVPQLSLGMDTSVCPGQSVSFSILISGVDIVWPDGSMENTFVANAPGEVYASISNSCGISTDTIEIILLPDAPQVALGPDLSICPGELITLDPGVAGSYSWQDGSSDPVHLVTSAGTYSVTISNACGIGIDTVIVTESLEGPMVDLGPDTIACEGETIQLLAGVQGVSYQWQDGSTMAVFTAVESGIYYLTVQNLCGTDSDTIEVLIEGNVPAPSLGPDTTLCEGEILLLNAVPSTQTTNTWPDGSHGDQFIVNTPGTIVLIQENDCGTGFDTTEVSYNALPPDIDLGPDTVLCPGDAVLLMSPISGYDMMWQDGSQTASIIADREQWYILQLENDCGQTRDSVFVAFDTLIPMVNLDETTALCPGETVILDASQPFAATYIWSTGSTLPAVQISLPGIYAVNVSTPCAVTDAVIEVVQENRCDEDGPFYVPNVFSPNDDQSNDVFILHPSDEIEWIATEGKIFDRWGNLIFSSSALPFVWDGRFHDEPMSPGVYVYLIRVVYEVDGKMKEKILSGDVTLVR